MIVVVKTRAQLKNDPPLVTHNPNGTLTRVGAVVEARKLWGDLGTISSDEYPLCVWCIGRFDVTVGRGKTWEVALQRSRARKAKLDARETARMFREAEALEAATVAREFMERYPNALRDLEDNHESSSS